MNTKESFFSLVRPGLAIYGLYPENIDREKYGLNPALSWVTKIVFLKKVKKGTAVSYGQRWIAPRDSKIATLCVGYADGYPRALSNKSYVIIKGQRCPVIGRVCMDMIMVDVTEIEDTAVGDSVVLIGQDGGVRITAEEVAKWANTVNYEITTGISYRVPRVYKK
jgi:alanine racemase